MIFSYYTPKAIAYYFIKNNFTIEKQFKSINRLYEVDYTFIHPKYKKDKKLFKQDTQENIEYFMDSTNYLNTEKTIRKDFEQLGISYEDNVSEEELLDYFFITVRLDKILKNQFYSRKKLRTLLNTYGYKRKSNKIISHLQDCLSFYHITAYVNKEPVNFLEVNLDQMITFIVQDFEKIIEEDKISTKIKLIYELLENEIMNYNNNIKILREKEFVKYSLNNRLLFEIFFKEEFLKIQFNTKETELSETDLKLNYYIENNNICLYLHDRKDIEDSMKLIKHNLNQNKNNFTNLKINKSTTNKIKANDSDNKLQKDKFVSEFYQKIDKYLR